MQCDLRKAGAESAKAPAAMPTLLEVPSDRTSRSYEMKTNYPANAADADSVSPHAEYNQLHEAEETMGVAKCVDGGCHIQ